VPLSPEQERDAVTLLAELLLDAAGKRRAGVSGVRGFKTTVPPGKRVIPGMNQRFETPQG
jgi:hypothetical protein